MSTAPGHTRLSPLRGTDHRLRFGSPSRSSRSRARRTLHRLQTARKVRGSSRAPPPRPARGGRLHPLARRRPSSGSDRAGRSPGAPGARHRRSRLACGRHAGMLPDPSLLDLAPCEVACCRGAFDPRPLRRARPRRGAQAQDPAHRADRGRRRGRALAYRLHAVQCRRLDPGDRDRRRRHDAVSRAQGNDRRIAEADEQAPRIHGGLSVSSTEVVDPAALTSSGIVIKGDLAESLTSRK
jgi:hypothetical protein